MFWKEAALIFFIFAGAKLKCRVVFSRRRQSKGRRKKVQTVFRRRAHFFKKGFSPLIRLFLA